MELDVHLIREGDEPWGIDIDGGKEKGTSLTIVKVESSSPAHRAGLQPGDILSRIGDRLASDLSRVAAIALLTEAVGSVSLGVCRGLYDPVLDDYEAIYEPIERADSDLRSEPTEVSPPRYIELPEIPVPDLNDFRPITESRSLTASPFLSNTKPYRPFSTEPLSVPSLEDPIILNPKFKDDFEDILEGINIDKVETKFKLPVSQQYDPNYKKKVDGILEKSMERDVCESKVNDTEALKMKIDEYIEVKEDFNEIKDVRQKYEAQSNKEEVRFEEEMKLEIDMENIEKTAIDVVEESIERAVSVTEEIQKEVEVELRVSATREIKEKKIEHKTEEICESRESISKAESMQEFNKYELSNESVELRNEVSQKYKEAKDAVNFVENSRNGTDKPPKELLYIRENKNKMKTHEVKTEMSEFVKKDFEDSSETKRQSSDGKQKSFQIGLKTIPNIKGMAQSSYHFDLLMKTFFIHLTDVMVAMSRFILTQPALELEMKAERVIKDQLITGLRNEEMKCNYESKKNQSQKSSKAVREEVVQEYRNREEKQTVEKKEGKEEEIKKQEIKIQEYIDIERQEIERRRLTGAEIVQKTQRKPKQLTNIMDAVITEFETKSGLETSEERRSRSSSRIGEAICESDTLLSQESTNILTSKKSASSCTELKESRISEHESREVIMSSTKPEKQMYVAVVESHVYTNKDAIIEEMTEKASIGSTEEMKTAIEMNHQNVEKQETIKVTAQAVEKSKTLADAESTVATEISLEESKEINENKVDKREAVVQQELLTSIASESTDVIEDLQVKSFNVSEVFEKKAIITSEENYKAIATQSTETILEENQEEITELIISEKQASSKIDQLAIANAVSTDIIMDDSKVEIFEAEESKAKTAIIKSEETFKTAAIETSEVTLEEAIEQHAVTLEAGHATVRETNNLAVAGIIETKTEEDKVKTPKPTEDEYASLKIIKEEIVDDQSVDITEISEAELIKKSIEVESYSSEQISSYQSEKLHIRTDIAQQRVSSQVSVGSDENNNIDTPTPSTVPPTPLTDEYVFKFQIPLPKITNVIPRDDSLDHEDLSIVKKRLVPHIETSIDEQIIYDPPLPTPTEDKVVPVYTKPGLKGGSSVPLRRKEYIREIERKSSLLASAIDQTIKCIEEYKEEVGIDKNEVIVEEPPVEEEPRPEDELPGFRQVQFKPEVPTLPRLTTPVPDMTPSQKEHKPYVNECGSPLGTAQGIVDGLEEPCVDEERTKELGKPGMTEDKIAELISGESEMLREAHVMGLSRVLSSHMSKPDDSSVDFNKIKPLVESLKNSKVLAALNEELKKSQEEEKKKEERKWTTFLQKPQRPAPRARCGYYGFLPQEPNEEGPYKVKIVKQPKPKVAPDYKPEDFDTGPLPWEERALTEPDPVPVAPEDPILIPEESPEILIAEDPTKESEVPDLEDTGIELPPPQPEVPEPIPEEIIEPIEEVKEEPPGERTEEKQEEKEMKGEVEEMAEQLVQNVKSMVDPNAPVQQQLAQMRAQLAALAQLPCVIQQSLEMLTRHLTSISQQDSCQVSCQSQSQMKTENSDEVQLRVYEGNVENQEECPDSTDNTIGHVTVEEIGSPELNESTIQEVQETKITLTAEEYAALKREEEMMIEEQMKKEKLKKVEEKMEQESRQLKQRAPRVGKPKPVFGPINPEVRPVVLPGGRRWKGPKDVFNDQFIAETLSAQSEILQGKVMGFESDRLPYDERINFMKWEKPPVNLDHLKDSEVYRLVHNMEQTPLRRVDLLTPVVAEADYRERCRSATPAPRRVEEHLDIPQQLQP